LTVRGGGCHRDYIIGEKDERGGESVCEARETDFMALVRFVR